MNKPLILVLILTLAMAGFGAVKKKKFSVEKSNAPVATEIAADTSIIVEPVVETPVDPSMWKQFTSAQANLREGISQKIIAMKNGDWNVIWAFLLICFVYGALHALGPGHGKSIVVGYFLARRGGWKQGLSMGAMITFTHTMSAVLLLFILYGILKAAVFPTFEVGRIGIEKVCYGLVMLTGVLLVAMAIRELVASRKHKREAKLNTNASWKEIATVAAITGIVPCPAVALIVLFCLLNNMVALSLIASAFICIGMTLTNMSFGVASIALRKGVDKGAAKSGNLASAIYTAVTILGGIIVFTTGLMLMMNLNA